MWPGLVLLHSSSHFFFLALAGMCQCSDHKTMVRDFLHLSAGKEKGTVQNRPWDVYLIQGGLVVGSGLVCGTRRGQKSPLQSRGRTLLWILTSPDWEIELGGRWNHRTRSVGLHCGTSGQGLNLARIQKFRVWCYCDNQTRVMTTKIWFCYRNSISWITVIPVRSSDYVCATE